MVPHPVLKHPRRRRATDARCGVLQAKVPSHSRRAPLQTRVRLQTPGPRRQHGAEHGQERHRGGHLRRVVLVALVRGFRVCRHVRVRSRGRRPARRDCPQKLQPRHGVHDLLAKLAVGGEEQGYRGAHGQTAHVSLGDDRLQRRGALDVWAQRGTRGCARSVGRLFLAGTVGQIVRFHPAAAIHAPRLRRPEPAPGCEANLHLGVALAPAGDRRGQVRAAEHAHQREGPVQVNRQRQPRRGRARVQHRFLDGECVGM
mmetsp:Transcript_7265/g.29462  ORF Transcript_7265/g.29462 Transcript_7265/m.29462 type:complete len:257 (+) Transcript_7265:2284-3054(+)